MSEKVSSAAQQAQAEAAEAAGKAKVG